MGRLLVGVEGKSKSVKTLYVGVGGVSKKVKKLYVGVEGKSKLVFEAAVATKTLQELPVGAKVRDTTSTYYGLPIDGILLEHDCDGSNSATFVSEKILCFKGFDGKEASNTSAGRKAGGSNRYKYSNLFQWLNSTGAAGSWYSAQHSYDAPPIDANFRTSANGYTTEKGFLANFSANMRNALLTFSKTTKLDSTDGGGTESVSGKIHLPSTAEVCGGSSGEGVIYDYFTGSADKRVAYPTQPCIDNDRSTWYSDKSIDKAYGYWTRTQTGSGYFMYGITEAGAGNGILYAFMDYIGVRPLWCLPDSLVVTGEPDSNGYYNIIW